MKRKLVNYLIMSACLMIGLQIMKMDNEKHEKTTKTNYQTVVFKDDQDTLVPIEIDFNQAMEADLKYRNMLEVMKSTDYEYLGLYPVLDANLEVNALTISEHALTFDLSNHLNVKDNQEALDIFELFAYVFCNDEIEKVNLKIDGQDVTTLTNSTIPATCITNRLGINNFETTTNYLYKTTPVVVYEIKTINNQDYYVPITKRVETAKNDIDSKVAIVLNEIDYEKPLTIVKQSVLKDGKLSIHLSSSILNDNESIDHTLYQQIVKSVEKLENVKEVSIYIDEQMIEPIEDVNGEMDNRIKI